MKKKIIVTSFLIFALIGCQSQSKIDLSELNLNNPLNIEKSDLVKQIDLDQTTGLPYYSTYQVDKYKYQDVDFLINYPKKKKYLKSSIGFSIDNNNKLLGFFISTYNFKESNKLFDLISKKYGKPIIIHIANNNWPYSGYYWKQTKNGFDILLSQSQEEINNGDEKVVGFSSEVYFIKHDLKFGNMETRETILENFIRSHKQ